MFKPLPHVAKPPANSAKPLFELLPMSRTIKSSSNDILPTGDGDGICTKNKPRRVPAMVNRNTRRAILKAIRAAMVLMMTPVKTGWALPHAILQF
ncbi:hypothetical protein [Bartonella sp. AU18XJBT]|uniref:hypothetical protein n=1 Tax=Bartonella sp. AU18XJBT TaxID=3019089 RepID=UPI00236004B3|nr:hypothetical protein [Bartonella sp. AU18XJBT]